MGNGEDEVEYESDPEEEKRFLGRRRRAAASDDEDSEREEEHTADRRAPLHPVHSDDSDGQGAAADYDDEDDDAEVCQNEEDEEEVYEEDDIEAIDWGEEGKEGRDGIGTHGVEVHERAEMEKNHVGGEGEEGGEGKKESEPFSVPTAGAFYMHDDRFRYSAGGRHRRTFGGRKLWELKDDKRWGHDKFEEMTKQERRNEQRRRGLKGNYRGRDGKNGGPDQGYAGRSRSRAFTNDDYQNQVQKSARARGPRKYNGTMRDSSDTHPMQDKHLEKPLDHTSNSNSGRNFTPTTNNEFDNAPLARKNSSLSFASPPFYPSSSASKDVALAHKKDLQVGSASRIRNSADVEENFFMQQASSLMQGKNVVDSVGIAKLYINDSVVPSGGEVGNNMQIQFDGSSLGSSIQSSQSRAQERDVSIPMPMTYQPVSVHNQGNRVSPATHINAVQRSPGQSGRAPSQQPGQSPVRESQGSSLSKTTSLNSYESRESETTSESDKSKAAMGKGKSSVQSSGKAYTYGGTQVMGSEGNVNAGPGDQNFPTFLPVVQFGSQNRAGVTMPALGMAFPGYVAQPQLGVGNSEMTWLPVLTGAAGTLGATYCPPYIAIDGAYHAHASGQSSMGCLSKETTVSKPTVVSQPSQRPDIMSDDSGQRQKPRRYSEMDFKQPSTSI